MSKKFSRVIFVGGSETSKEVTELRKRFEEGLKIASSLQSDEHSTHPLKRNGHVHNGVRSELEEIIEDIAMAFTGSQIKFVKKDKQV